MRRKATLAVDRMSSKALWDFLISDLIRLEAGQLGGLENVHRTIYITRARRCAVELRMRGAQTTLDVD